MIRIQDKVLRMIDANVNRTTEGLRVAEDIVRFVLDDEKLTSRLKHIRHELSLNVRRVPPIECRFRREADGGSVGRIVRR